MIDNYGKATTQIDARGRDDACSIGCAVGK